MRGSKWRLGRGCARVSLVPLAIHEGERGALTEDAREEGDLVGVGAPGAARGLDVGDEVEARGADAREE